MVGCKLNRNAAKYLISKGTNTEISLLIYLSKVANEFGAIRDLNYSLVCSKLRFSRQSFYNALYKLEDNKIISIDNFSSRLNCNILDNIFNGKNFDKGYINTNLDFLYSCEFLKSKVNVKKIVLLYLLAFKSDAGGYRVSFKKLIHNIGGLVRKSLMWEYMDMLKNWFNIKEVKKEHMDDTVFILTLEDFSAKESTKDIYWSSKIDTFCKNFGVEALPKDKRDVIKLIKIYGYKKATACQFQALLHIIAKTSIDHKKLIAPLINKTLRIILSKSPF